MSLMALVFCASCSSADEDVNGGGTQKQEEKVSTKLNFTGEILDITESPWTRSDEAKDWYVIQVYEDTRAEGASKASWSYYAWGLFDDVSNLKLDLVKGKKYKFVVYMYVDASEKIEYIFRDNNEESEYNLTAPTNVFEITSKRYFQGESVTVYTRLKEASPYSSHVPRPHIEQFYGNLEDYTAIEGGTATVNMKRSSFALKLIAKNFTSGSIAVDVDGTDYTMNMTPEQSEVQEVFTCFDKDKDEDDIYFTITWTKEDGTKVKLASRTITVKRNVVTTITFNVGEASSATSGNNIVITIPDSEKEWGTGETIQAN